ncbi:Gramicidin S synthase 2 [compost metagenome]
MISEQETDILLHSLNGTNASYPLNKTINELFEEQVSRVPDLVAVVSQDRSITYGAISKIKSNCGFTPR